MKIKFNSTNQMIWNLLALTCEANIEVVKPTGYGTLGTFDIKYKGQSLSQFDAGTYVNLIVNGEKQPLDFSNKVTNNGLEAQFSYEITDDIVKIIYTINNPTSQPIRYKLGVYSDVDFNKGFIESKDKVYPLTDKSFYVEQYDDADYKFVYLLMSKNGYYGPDDYFYGNSMAVDRNADKYFLKFDNYNPTPTLSDAVDILISYSWKERELAANSQEILALKLGFTKTPKISKQPQDKTQYSSSGSIPLTINVDDDKFGKS